MVKPYSLYCISLILSGQAACNYESSLWETSRTPVVNYSCESLGLVIDYELGITVENWRAVMSSPEQICGRLSQKLTNFDDSLDDYIFWHIHG